MSVNARDGGISMFPIGGLGTREKVLRSISKGTGPPIKTFGGAFKFMFLIRALGTSFIGIQVKWSINLVIGSFGLQVAVGDITTSRD